MRVDHQDTTYVLMTGWRVELDDCMGKEYAEFRRMIVLAGWWPVYYSVRRDSMFYVYGHWRGQAMAALLRGRDAFCRAWGHHLASLGLIQNGDHLPLPPGLDWGFY